jgi:hypothetical protein
MSSSALRLLLLACSASALGQSVTATADLSGATTVLRQPMLQCIGSSHGSMYMWEDYRNHVRSAQSDIGFKFIRGHGLLGA